MSSNTIVDQIVNIFKVVSSECYLEGNFICDLDDQYNLDNLENFKGVVVNYSGCSGYDYCATPDDDETTDCANARYKSPYGTYKLYKVQVYKLKYQYAGKEFSFSQILTPMFKHHCAEFEGLFGFGSGCSNFRTDKKIFVCSKHISIKYDELKIILETQSVDREMLKFLLWLSVHGGYLNKHGGTEKLNNQLSALIECEELSKTEINQLAFLKN